MTKWLKYCAGKLWYFGLSSSFYTLQWLWKSKVCTELD